MTHVQLNGRHRRQLFVEAVKAKTLSSEDFDRWDKARKAANAVNRRDCRPELIAAKDQAELSARTVCNRSLDQGSRVELNKEENLEASIDTNGRIRSIEEKQQAESNKSTTFTRRSALNLLIPGLKWMHRRPRLNLAIAHPIAHAAKSDQRAASLCRR